MEASLSSSLLTRRSQSNQRALPEHARHRRLAQPGGFGEKYGSSMLQEELWREHEESGSKKAGKSLKLPIDGETGGKI